VPVTQKEFRPTRILLVEDDIEQAGLIARIMAKTGNGFEINWVPQLSQGLQRLEQGDIDLVILDLGLPDSEGLETFIQVNKKAPDLPVVVLTGLADENIGLAAVRRGAQDYLIKGSVDYKILAQTIRYALERRRSQEALLAERQRLYAVLDTLPAHVYVIAPDHEIRFANRRFRETFGAWQGRCCYEVFHGRTTPCEMCPAEKIIQTQQCQVKEETQDNARTYEIYTYPFHELDGSPLILNMGIDITARKQAEGAVREREEQLATIYENAPLIMLLIDVNRRIVRANKLAEQVTGKAASDLVGRYAGEALNCVNALDDPQGCGFGRNCKTCMVRRIILDTFASGRSYHQVEASLTFAIDGKPKEMTFLLCTARLFVQGLPQVLVTIQDITERKQMEKTLWAEERFLEDIFNSIQDGLSVLDLDHTILRINPAMKKFPHTEPMVGRKCYEVFHDASKPCEPCVISQTFATGEADFGVVEVTDTGGDKKFSEIYGYPFINHATGKVQGVIEYVRDITERQKMKEALRETEGLFQQIFEDAGDAITLHDRGKIIDVNRQACRSLGYSREELLQMSIWDFEVELDEDALKQIWERPNGDPTVLAGRQRRRDGSTFPVEVHSGEVVYRGRKLRLATVRDVTDRYKAEEALRKSEQKLRFLTSQLLSAQEDERKRLSQGLHDELGHALLAMKLDVGAMAKQLLPEQTGLAENLNELMGYMDEVLENVRRLYLNLTPGDLEDLGLTAALKSLCEEFGRHQEKIIWSIQLENLDRVFPVGVQTAVYRIFQEILTNIGKHADPSEVVVAAQARDGQVYFEVRDNGKGFDMDNGWQSSAKAGMGLLTLAERIRMLGGSLEIWSKKNQGTEISFTIPGGNIDIRPEQQIPILQT
jgi:PAS domain S-box-containing protein